MSKYLHDQTLKTMDDDVENEEFVDLTGCQVVFLNIKESYGPNEKLPCEFSLRLNISEKDDWYIFLIVVGWSDFRRQCITKREFACMELVAGKKNTYSFNFDPSETPDSNHYEFYQFLFCNEKTGGVEGVSYPFQIFNFEINADKFGMLETDEFKKFEDMEWCFEPNIKDMNDCELSDTVLIENKTTILEDSLATAVKENSQLKEIKIYYENEVSQLNKDLEDAKNLLVIENEKIYGIEKYYKERERSLQANIDLIENDALLLRNELQDLRAKEHNQTEKDKLHNQDLHGLMSQNSELIVRNRELDDTIKKLKEEAKQQSLELNKQKSCFGELAQAYELVQKKLHSEVEINKKQTEENEALQSEVTQLKSSYIEQEIVSALHSKLSFSKEEIDEQKALIDHLVCENKSMKTLIETFKVNVEEQEAENKKLKEDCIKKGFEIDNYIKVIHEAEIKIAAHEAKLNDECKPNGDTEANHEQVKQAKMLESGSQHALKMANAHLRQQLIQSRIERDHYKMVCEESTKHSALTEVEILKKQVSDLRVRLCLGKTFLDKKQMECVHLRNKLISVSKEIKKPDPSKSTHNQSTITENLENPLEGKLAASLKNQAKLQQAVEELKKKSAALAEHYEEKIRLIKEEYHAKGSTFPKQNSDWQKFEQSDKFPVTSLTLTNQTPEVYSPPLVYDGIYFPPSYTMRDCYPPSLKTMDRQVHSHASQHDEPAAQLIPNRTTCRSPSRSAKGVSRAENVSKHESLCPVCKKDFSDKPSLDALRAHINSHFE